MRQYQRFFEMEGCELEFTADALKVIAEKALERDTGARALRGVIEELMLDLMYRLPEEGRNGTLHRLGRGRSRRSGSVHPTSPAQGIGVVSLHNTPKTDQLPDGHYRGAFMLRENRISDASAGEPLGWARASRQWDSCV